MTARIRDATQGDWPAIWSIVREVVVAADTFPYNPELTEDEARALWMVASPGRTTVAVDGAEVAGTANMYANRAGPGAHVASASFMVASAARGRGLGRALVEDALSWARAADFRAMQFNAVAETNGGLGIDLGANGTTANDGGGDPDAGPNTLQNGPEIEEASATDVEWEFETEPNSTYRLEFFASDACDPSGSGEGQTHLDTIQVTTDANGDADDITPITATVGQQVTMTATRLVGAGLVARSTSELSPCEVVVQ